MFNKTNATLNGDEMFSSCINIDPSDEIVISGIAGRFPKSDNIKHLQENLFNKIDLVDKNHGRWDLEHPDLPPRIGVVRNLNKFDADFFGVPFDQAHTFDPAVRMLLEHTYEAIVDAGVNPKELRGRNTTVITAASYLDSQKKFLYQNLQIGGLGAIGCSKSIMSNIISHWLNIKGPSYVIDTACSSSSYAIYLAYRAIMSGQCQDAIVGCSNLCLNPLFNMQFSRLGILSFDGFCRPFDIAANGYARSETLAVIYLQKAKHAKRIYATFKHIKINNDGYKDEGVTFPSTRMQGILLQDFYKECGISSSRLDYVEAHATATKVGDPEEMNAISNTLCKNRKTPLMIGSVKSNLGHSEPASGLNQVAKVIIAFETGYVPPNINFTKPRKDIPSLLHGSIQVVTEPLFLENGYIGINSFGFGGANAHMLLKWNPKKKFNNGTSSGDLPRLVVLSGRTEESVKLFLNDVANHSTDMEYIRLLHDIHSDNIDGHPWRGYAVLNAMERNPIKKIQNYGNVKRPVCFLFSALGSRWLGIGRELLKFCIFANAMKRCDAALKPHGITVTDILNKSDNNENVMHTFVATIAIQIGLVDLLTSLGIIPDYVISHSASELVCAYVDDCLTIEQAILAAYFIGLACMTGRIVYSSMAIVNLDYECLKNICPKDIEIACRNNKYNSIITGPSESVQKFIEELQGNNIHIEEISCNNIPYHSRYLASMKSDLLLNLNRVISQPKERTKRWISTSIPRTEWSSLRSKLSSANYHTHSILNTVLFEQALHMIPSNAVIIEFAPENVLQRLKAFLHKEMTNIVLIKRGKRDDLDVFLQGIGKLYNCGLQPQVANLYSPIEFPVSRGTPMISPSIRWDHSEDWFVPSFDEMSRKISSKEKIVTIDLMDEDFEYMAGHIIDGKNLLPATGYLAFVWQFFSLLKGDNEMYKTTPIVFRDVKFLRVTHMTTKNTINLKITMQEDSGKFEVLDEDSIIVTGTAYLPSDPNQEMIPTDLLPKNGDEEEDLSSRDIYKELKLRGYQYSGGFRGLTSASFSGHNGHITWTGNWVTFIDNMLQMYIIGCDTRDLYVPTSIQKLVINPALHLRKVREVSKKPLSIRVYKEIDAIVSDGIEIRGLKATAISRRKILADPVIEEYKFVAHCDGANVSLDEAIRISMQLLLEDHQVIKLNAVELVEDNDNVGLADLSSSLIVKVLDDIPLIQANIALLTSPNRFNSADLPPSTTIADLNKLHVIENALIVTGFNLLSEHQSLLERVLPLLKEGGYIITREKHKMSDYSKYLREHQLHVILEKCVDKEIFILLKKNIPIKERTVVYINNADFDWLEKLKMLLDDGNRPDKNKRIMIVGEGDSECGLLGFINCLRKEPGGELVRGVLIQYGKALKFSLQDPFYLQQLQKDMAINVLRANKTWGSYRHLLLSCPKVEPVSAAYVCQRVHGDLSTFCWTENDIQVDAANEDLVRVVYSSINFRDIMLATGKLKNNPAAISQGRFQQMNLGMEYVGYDSNGNRVMGLRDNRCIANVILRDKLLSWNIPDTWTFEEAATVPCAYTTSYYALFICGNMKKGDKVLIHSGTGAVGQSAIYLALNEGCEVFATVGTSDKQKFIRETFPSIPESHIGNSRDTSFEQMIMQQTNSRGVDIVLNSLAEEKLLASVRCLARNGRFLEIGKFDLISDNPLNVDMFAKGISFHGVLLDNMFSGNHKYISQLCRMMTEGFKNGVIKPLQAKIFPKTEIETAFRYMTAGKHMGKIIINIHKKDTPLNAPIIAQRRYYCRSNKNYIILGGLGGFGLELTDWLILRGAKNIVLTSRTGIKNGYQRMKIKLWESYGVNILIVDNIDAANPTDCEYLLRTAEKRAAVDAIFNLAVVLKDNILKNQSTESFVESFKSKAWATQTIDRLSRKICLNLRHFVVFSSVSCGRGNAGQTNYGMANSVMERVCERRAEEGLPGLAIQWGAIGDVGLVADMQEENKELVIGGILQQRISSCLEELEKCLLQSRPIVSSMVVSEKKIGSSELDNAAEIIATIMNIKDMKSINHNTSLSGLGMDSMMAVEIKQILEDKFDIFLTPQEIRNLNFAKLLKLSNRDICDNNPQVKEPSETNMPNSSRLMFGMVTDEDFFSGNYIELLTKKEKNTKQIFLLPGIDGGITIFKYLVSIIEFPAICLRYNINNIDAVNSISEIANHLLKILLSRLSDGNEFVLVGYSFGCILAIEIMSKLEAINLKGRLILIDGSPKYMQAIVANLFPISTDAEMQDNILNLIMDIYDIQNSNEILGKLRMCKTWDEKLETFAKHFLVVNTSLSSTNLKTLCTTIYSCLTALQRHNPSILPNIKSPITLIKPSESLIREIDEDYGLHKVTQNKVGIYYAKGNHVTILKNEQVAIVINGDTI